MRLRRSTRLHTFDYTGLHRYSATICADGRKRIFVDDVSVDLIRSHLSRVSIIQGFAVLAYCFMPDHLHVLVEGTALSSDFLEFMRSFKQHTAFAWKRNRGERLWERSYYEHVLRAEEDTATAARYIVANPVRAGLVENPADYPYSGSLVLTTRDLLASVERA